MSLTGASYWHTRSDCLPANDRQISAASRSVERERAASSLIPPATKAYRSHPQGMSAPTVPASPALASYRWSFGDILMMSFYL